MGPVMAVARWEYERFAKPRDLIMGTVFFAFMFGVFGFVTGFVERKSTEPKTVAVWGGEALGLASPETLQRFELVPEPGNLSELEERLARGECDAVLVVRDFDDVELRVDKQHGWQDGLLVLLSAYRQQYRIQESDLPLDVTQALLAPQAIPRVVVDATDEAGRRAESVTVFIVVGTMMLGLFLGFSYVFVAITGEKTQRVTESVLAAIAPQEWIDGKILGLTAVTAINVVCYALGYLLYKVIARIFFSQPLQFPAGIGDPVALLWMLLFAFLGFGFWFTLFALVAATINDPNSSSRSSLMFLPFLPLGLTLAGMDDADAGWMRVLALIPGVSPAAMPVRLLRGSPSLTEVLLSLALLAGMIWLFRRAAGRVFGVSMLMTGKEPRWSEVWRWVRAG